MNKLLLFLWTNFLINAVISYIYLINTTPSNVNNIIDDKKNNTKNGFRVFIESFGFLLSIAGFILFTIWIIKFSDNKNILKLILTVTSIICILSTAFMIYLNNYKVQASAYVISSYTFVIFLGTFIGFFIK